MNPMFYFLLAFTAVLAATAEPGDLVYDTRGKYVYEGIPYYVVPYSFSDGGLSVGAIGGNQCPLYITQLNSEDDMGIPVRFSNWEFDDENIAESETLNIEMPTIDTICGAESTYWWVAPLDKDSKKRFVVAGPKPGREDSSNGVFQIVRFGGFFEGYYILFCPNGNDDCIYVGIFVDEHGVRRLALDSTPFAFVFQEAYDWQETSPKTKSII